MLRSARGHELWRGWGEDEEEQQQEKEEEQGGEGADMAATGGNEEQWKDDIIRDVDSEDDGARGGGGGGGRGEGGDPGAGLSALAAAAIIAGTSVTTRWPSAVLNYNVDYGIGRGADYGLTPKQVNPTLAMEITQYKQMACGEANTIRTQVGYRTPQHPTTFRKEHAGILAYMGFLCKALGYREAAVSLEVYTHMHTFFKFLSFLKYEREVITQTLMFHIRLASRVIRYLGLTEGGALNEAKAKHLDALCQSYAQQRTKEVGQSLPREPIEVSQTWRKGEGGGGGAN